MSFPMKSVVGLVFATTCTALSFATGACSSGVPAVAAQLDAGYGAATTAHDPCTAEGFRNPTPNSVVCPGAQGCVCGNGDICCLQAVDSSKGRCGKIGTCRSLALTCDGPEDCNAGPTTTAKDGMIDGGVDAASPADAGAPDATIPPPPPPPAPGVDAGTGTPVAPSQVCCLDEASGTTGGGSTCRPQGGCVGKVLCRVDDDCKSVPGLSHCRPADYGTPGVEDRGLDGLVGTCQR